MFHTSIAGFFLKQSHAQEIKYGKNRYIITLPDTNSSPLKIGHPKRKRESIPIHFQVREMLGFREEFSGSDLASAIWSSEFLQRNLFT